MDRTVDPCVDFYKYACGGWMKNNPIPPDQPRWDVYAKLTEENMRYLWGILEEAAKLTPNRTPLEQKIGDFFAACMDTGTVDAAGTKPLDPMLKQIAAMRSVRDLAPVLAKMHLITFGNGFVFGSGSGQDYDDSNSVITFITAGGLGLPDRDYYLKTDPKSIETRAKYLEHVQKTFELIGDPATQASANAQTVMRIETAMAKASLTLVDKRHPYKLKHKLTLKQVKALTPSFDWDKYFAGIGLRNPGVINVTEPEFFKALQALLTSEKVADWTTYLRWHLGHAEAPYLSKPFLEERFDFYSRYLRGVPEMPPRWKQCVRLVDDQLGEALGQEFVKKTFGPQIKDRTVDLTKRIETAMESEIKTLRWMGAETKKNALEKLHLVVNKVGYPDKWRDYSSVMVERADFAGNVERATLFETRRDLNKIGKPLDRTEWGMTPPTVNAYYNPQMNDINFPAGVLQPPLFDAKMDDAPNYGNTGATIGHELTHGFDDEGRQFDGKGNLKDWWTKDDAAQFEQRTKCILDQYGKYIVVDDLKINSKLTLGEDVADLGGTLLAYIAWKAAEEGKNLQPMDGLASDQRFFVGMAQWACSNDRPEARRTQALTNPHSPNEYRINGVVSNMPEFARAFACKVGQPMVRTDACRIW
jgi:endothelin-converting enzyme/putative endopeptidase